VRSAAGQDLAEELAAMSSERDAFGPNLRRLRMQRGISIYEIVTSTNVNAALWEGLERNDLSRWPTGIYARSYVRSYAKAVGVDPESTVDEFCRWFPQGDRRAETTIRVQAQIVGHQNLVWSDEVPPKVMAQGNRRGGAVPPKREQVKASSRPLTAFAQMFMRLTRLPR
jgi:transcriptional regulator with XRE-family HTH domain